jgi:SAM-dependent methyltransferase
MHTTRSVSSSTPSPWIARFAALIAPGASVLDLACGNGRHARYLAARGARVTAVDRDPQAIEALAASRIVEALLADLEGGPWPFDGQQFDAIVVCNYLHRPRFAALRAALAPGGVLLYETFARGQARFGKPSNPDFLLEPGELLQRCAGLHVLAYEDGLTGDRSAAGSGQARIQRIAAIAPAADRTGADADIDRLRLGAG